MLLFTPALLVITLAASHGQPAPPAGEDEARIEVLIAAERGEREARAAQREVEREAALAVEADDGSGVDQATRQFPPPAGTRIAFEDLDKMKGYAVRVHTRGGYLRTGIVQDVGANEVQLRARMRGGYAEFTVARRQIVGIEAE